MPMQWEKWRITTVYQDVGEEVGVYEIYYRGRKIQRITKAGRFDNMYRLIFGRNDSTVVDKHCVLTVGV